MLTWTNSLQVRLLAVALALLAFLGILLGGVAYRRQSALIEEQMRIDVVSRRDLLMALWADEGKRAHALAEMFLLVPGVPEAFEARDRERLLELTLPLYRTLNERHGVGQVQFHLPDPASFLRLNSPGRFGDGLSFRKALAWVNREQQIFVGAEQGRTGMFIRGLLPVFLQERHLGSLEVGSDVRPLLEQAHAETGAHYALFSTEAEIQASGFLPEQYLQGHPLLFSTDPGILLRLPEGFLERALAGEELYCLQGDDQFMFSPIVNAMEEVVGVLVTQVDASAFVAALAAMGRLFVFLVSGAVFVAFLLLLGMLRSLVLIPLQKVTSLSSALALEGDLSRDVPEELLQRKDEIGTMARGFQALAGSLRKQIGAIADVSSELVKISDYIQSAVSGIASGSEETASSVMETSATLEEIRRTAEMTDEKSRSVAANSKRGLQSLQTANESMGRLWEGIDRIGERMPILAETILRLDAQSQEIGEITETVEDIAGQSNILAVNAALEAAKSGEQGKGFWVVAREVRSLAEHSKKSTLQVQGILRDIRKAAAAAVSAAEQGVAMVESGTQEAVHARESVTIISAELEDSARSAGQIAAATGELLGGMDQAAEAMESIKGATIQNASGMKEIEDAAKSLSEMSTTLSGLLGQYRLR